MNSFEQNIQESIITQKCWYVMRDLKRSNAKLPAYRLLEEKNIEVFTPMKWKLTIRNGRRVREKIPFIQDLLFVHATESELELIIKKTPTLQYRYLRGGAYKEPMTVREDEMKKFIHAVQSTENPHYYLLDEISPIMYNRKIKIFGGPLDGYEGFLITMRGSKIKRILIQLPALLSVSIEVNPEYIQLL